MPQYSKQIQALKPSPTVALNAAAKAMQRDGIDVVNLSVGEPDFTTPQPIIDAGIAALQAGKTKYSAAGGSLELRQAVAEKLARDNNLVYDPNDIVCGVGAKELLFHISLAMLNPGDEVIIPAPYWVSYTAHCEAIGAKPVVIPMQVDAEGQIDLTPAMIDAVATDRTRMVILNSPNNPGGYVLQPDSIKAIAAYLKSQDWWVVTDEIYEYLAFDTQHYSVLNAEPSLREKTLLVNGLSKGFAMTGWRVGYVAGPTQAIKYVKTLQTQSSTCLPSFIEPAAAAALQAGASIMGDRIDELKSRRDFVVDHLRKAGLKFIKPQGAFYVFIDLRDQLSSQTTLAFGEALLNKQHVAMVPGEAFGVPGFLRMSYAADRATLERGIAGIVAQLKG